MKRVTRDQYTYYFGPDVPTVLTVTPGETVVFETWDTSTGRVKRAEDVPAYVAVRDPNKVNPAAGPVRVLGAEPGDGLVVQILDIQLRGPGFVRLHERAGLVLEHAIPPGAATVEVDGDRLRMLTASGVVHLPARPMVGVIGTLPVDGRVHTAVPGAIGSNLDVRLIRPGARVHLPVHVAGAGLALGDVHAAMGDGEMSGTGVEIPADVTVRIDLVKGAGWSLPWLQVDGSLVTMATAPTLQEAVDQAVVEMAGRLSERLSVTKTEAVLLISAAGDVRVGQACRMPGLAPTAYVVFPEEVYRT